MSAAPAVNLKRVTLELGGKSALVVFNDADGKFIIFFLIIRLFTKLASVVIDRDKWKKGSFGLQ